MGMGTSRIWSRGTASEISRESRDGVLCSVWKNPRSRRGSTWSGTGTTLPPTRSLQGRNQTLGTNKVYVYVFILSHTSSLPGSDQTRRLHTTAQLIITPAWIDIAKTPGVG